MMTLYIPSKASWPCVKHWSLTLLAPFWIILSCFRFMFSFVFLVFLWTTASLYVSLSIPVWIWINTNNKHQKLHQCFQHLAFGSTSPFFLSRYNANPDTLLHIIFAPDCCDRVYIWMKRYCKSYLDQIKVCTCINMIDRSLWTYWNLLFDAAFMISNRLLR